jgi:two-component system, NarL family, nitrate/nitrite response regulator NarL
LPSAAHVLRRSIALEVLMPVVPAADQPQQVRVIVLADVQLYREGLARLLGENELIVVAGAGPTDRSCLPCIRSERPDVVLLEAGSACRPAFVYEIERAAPDARLVAYGVVDEGRQALECAEAGVAAFVSGEATGEQLVSTILGVARGEFSCSPRFAAALVQRIRTLAQSRVPATEDSPLTGRERGILALIDEGLSNKEIAARLGIEVCTVKNHVHHILEKMHATCRSQAAARARSMRPHHRIADPARGTGS